MEKTLSIGITAVNGGIRWIYHSEIELPAKDYEIEDRLQEARANYDKNFPLGK